MDTAADWIDTGEHDEACPHCAGDGCNHCGSRGLVAAVEAPTDEQLAAMTGPELHVELAEAKRLADREYWRFSRSSSRSVRPGGPGTDRYGRAARERRRRIEERAAAPVTADPTRLHDYLVRLALEAVSRVEDEPLGERGTLITTAPGRAHLEEVMRERMAQAAQVIVAELDEARAPLAGEVTARQLAAWASAQDCYGAPRIHQWRDSQGWHVTLSVVPHGSILVRVTEAVAADPQDALTMLMAGLVAS